MLYRFILAWRFTLALIFVLIFDDIFQELSAIRHKEHAVMVCVVTTTPLPNVPLKENALLSLCVMVVRLPVLNQSIKMTIRRVIKILKFAKKG